ncbi:AN1-type zinc finger protein-like [Tropilaelaps mercedesae]|uniref:AN1-type zinc finger protein-like n=1 Tax=Tropilaelaps mercedesae TaxID=418985 RepID=A0A1V9Y0E1_9ACAR|nr:AN1-type zinc finger protein-like [Tropilaelaps mercedesae]
MPKTTALVKEIVQARKAAAAKIEATGSASTCNTTKKVSPTALKVKLMKLKMKAFGDKGLPPEERVHFEIKLLDGSQKPFFFSKVWTIGRCLDFICCIEGILNNNNRANAKRLLLLRADQTAEGSAPSPLDTTLSLNDLMKNQSVQEADMLILAYQDKS